MTEDRHKLAAADPFQGSLNTYGKASVVMGALWFCLSMMALLVSAGMGVAVWFGQAPADQLGGTIAGVLLGLTGVLAGTTNVVTGMAATRRDPRLRWLLWVAVGLNFLSCCAIGFGLGAWQLTILFDQRLKQVLRGV